MIHKQYTEVSSYSLCYQKSATILRYIFSIPCQYTYEYYTRIYALLKVFGESSPLSLIPMVIQSLVKCGELWMCIPSWDKGWYTQTRGRRVLSIWQRRVWCKTFLPKIAVHHTITFCKTKLLTTDKNKKIRNPYFT